jgi:hypothetical protein
MSALLSGVRPSLLVPPWSVGGVAIGLDKLAVTRPVPEGEAVRLIVGWRDLPPLPGTPLWHRRRHPGRAWAGDDLRLARAAGERPAERGRVGGRYRREPGHPEGRRAGAPAAGTDGMGAPGLGLRSGGGAGPGFGRPARRGPGQPGWLYSGARRSAGRGAAARFAVRLRACQTASTSRMISVSTLSAAMPSGQRQLPTSP